MPCKHTPPQQSTNGRLLDALSHAGNAGDIASLKALAISESARADQMTRMLVAVLTESGPLRYKKSTFDSAGTAFTMTFDLDGWICLTPGVRD